MKVLTMAWEFFKIIPQFFVAEERKMPFLSERFGQNDEVNTGETGWGQKIYKKVNFQAFYG